MAAASSSAAPLPTIYALSPPHGKITTDDHGGYVVIVGWIMMCFFTISVLTRMLTRFIPVTLGGIDDALSGLSLIFGIAQTAAIHVSSTHGLGRHQNALPTADFRTYAKAYYAANLLYIFAVTFAKASLVFLIIRLSPARNVQRICQSVLLVITLWCIGEVFAFAFTSPPPNTWDYRQSGGVSLPALYYTFAIGDILTDALVVILPAYVIWQVQIPLQKRIAVIAVFASRIAVIICSAIRMSTLPSYVNDTDRSWHAVGPQTWIQVIQCLSIITACIPCLKPFLESLESGFMDISLGKVRGDTYGAYSGGSGRHGKSKKATTNNSYMMNSMGSQLGKKETNVDIHSVQPSPDDEIRQGHYLDTQVTRNPSVTESERVLTSKSSDSHSVTDEQVKDWRVPKPTMSRSASGDGIRVTREVEVRHETDDMRHGYGRAW